MEATALSLAKLALDSVLAVAKHAAVDDTMLLLGVRQEVSFISNELEMMQAFLRAAGASGRDGNEVVKIWVKQVRDLAYDVEDCLQEYLALDLGVGCSSPSAGWIRACLILSGQLRAQHRIAVRIKEAKSSVEEVSQRNLRYSIVVQQGAADPASCEHLVIPPTFAADVAAEEARLVGRVQQRADLIHRLTTSESDAPLQVVAVWGMGGMGKTTLVRDVLNSSELGQAFQRRAWVTMLHPFNAGEFLRSFVSQLDVEGSKGSAKMIETLAHSEPVQLVHELAHQLESKRYTVVLDDVSSVADWDRIKNVLPDKKMGSWIIVTTRYEDVAKHCSTVLPSQVYQLTHLSPEESLDLLCKKAHRGGPLPKELLDEANPILQRCCGLPLAITAVGGLLATKPKTSVEWKKLHDHLGSELKGNPGLEEIKKVLTSSYDGLPYHLKSCFLYLSIFPKYREIRQSRLLRRWMAEGIVTESRDMAPEEVGESYFNQLISRSMIQPSTKWINISDRINICQVHDMMREIILEKSIEENQLFVLDEHCSTLPREKIRHLVVTSGCCGRENILEGTNMSHIRSLTVFGPCPPRLIIPKKMRLLRVLDLEDSAGLKDTDLMDIGELRLLKYLGLRGTDVLELPESLGNLKFLEVLDIRGTKVTQLPQGIVKLQKLRFLRAGIRMRNENDNFVRSPSVADRFYVRKAISGITSSTFRRPARLAGHGIDPSGVRLPDGIQKLRSLRTLGAVDVGQGGKGTIKEIRMLTALQRLGVTGLAEKDGRELCATIDELRHLKSLEVRSPGKHGSLCCLASVSSPPSHLLTLRLYGHLGTLPGWIKKLNNVTKVKFRTTQLAQDAIEVLEDLPHLTSLRLWRKSYAGKELHLKADKFNKLKLMDLDGLEELVSVVIEEKAMPQLERLWLYRCCALSDGEDGVAGLPFLASLKEVRLKDVGEKDRLEAVLQRQVREHRNHPDFIVRKQTPASRGTH